MTAIPAALARTNLLQLIDQVNATSEPITISGQHGNAVLVSEDGWCSIQEMLRLMSVPGFTESVREARVEGVAAGATQLSW